MAPNGRSNLHEDAWQTDASVSPGPLGGPAMTRTSSFYARECASITFDSRGRLVTVCVGLDKPQLKILEPGTLREIANMDLPQRPPNPSANPTSSFAGGGYFYLDDKDRAVIPTGDRHVRVVAVDGDALRTVADYDVSRAVPSGDAIISALPDWFGTIWFASTKGVVGRIDKNGSVHSRNLGEPIGNSFAVDEWGSAYIVTDAALYRLDTGDGGVPHVVWRFPYANIGRAKPGQTEAGSGTTPTVMAGGLVAITDNADPMRIVVVRRQARLKRKPRQVCATPVFAAGASATDQSLIAAGRSIVTENNYGYSGVAATENGKSTTPGIWRVDVRPDLRGCRVVWRNDQVAAPSSVPKLNLTNGLVYAYEKQPTDGAADLWYLTALDFRTGQRAWRRYVGEGLGFNDNFAPVTFGPDGTFYSGVLGGLVALRDG